MGQATKAARPEARRNERRLNMSFPPGKARRSRINAILPERARDLISFSQRNCVTAAPERTCARRLEGGYLRQTEKSSGARYVRGKALSGAGRVAWPRL